MKYVTTITFFLFLISSCVLKKDPIPPTISFKTQVGYISDGVTVDTNAFIRIGVEAKKSNADMRYLEVNRQIDSSVVILYSMVLINNSKVAFDKTFDYRTIVTKTPHIEKYIFKISDDNGGSFEKVFTLKVNPSI